MIYEGAFGTLVSCSIYETYGEKLSNDLRIYLKNMVWNSVLFRLCSHVSGRKDQEMKTNDFTAIKNDTGLIPDYVYIEESDGSQKNVERYSGKEIFDTDSKNFHIFPMCKELRTELSSAFK